MDITELMILQHLYCTSIRKAVRKEVKNYDTCQRTKNSNIKYGKLLYKGSQEISWEKICVDLIGPLFIKIN